MARYELFWRSESGASYSISAVPGALKSPSAVGLFIYCSRAAADAVTFAFVSTPISPDIGRILQWARREGARFLGRAREKRDDIAPGHSAHLSPEADVTREKIASIFTPTRRLQSDKIPGYSRGTRKRSYGWIGFVTSPSFTRLRKVAGQTYRVVIAEASLLTLKRHLLSVSRFATVLWNAVLRTEDRIL